MGKHKAQFPQTENANKKFDIVGIKCEMFELEEAIERCKGYLEKPHHTMKPEFVAGLQVELLESKFRYTKLCMARAFMRGRIHTMNMQNHNGNPGFRVSDPVVAFKLQGEFVSSVLKEFEFQKGDDLRVPAYTTKHRQKHPGKYDSQYIVIRDVEAVQVSQG